MNKQKIAVGLSLIVLSSLVGCNKSKDKDVGTSGQAKVTMSNALAGAQVSSASGEKYFLQMAANTCPAGACPDPSVISKYEIKVISIGIRTESDSTTGYGSNIYVNPDCQGQQLQTEINGKYFNYIGMEVCDDEAITTFLDLAQPVADVNTALNSQYLPIAPGDYKLGSVNFCNDGDSEAENYKITLSNDVSLPAELRGETLEFINGMCGFDTAEMSPLMDVAEGSSVTVNFEYDLTNTVYYMQVSDGETAGQGCKIVGTSTKYKLCAQSPTFSASFSKD